MKTVLVTGCTGALAGVLIPHLKRAGYAIVGVTRQHTSVENSVQANITVRDEVFQLIEKTRPDLICHLAGSFSGNFQIDMAVNGMSSVWIYEALLAFKIKCRVLIIGSAAEYGLIEESENPVTEMHSLNPISIYGFTKKNQTEFMRYYNKIHGVDIVNARIFNLAIPALSEKLFYGKLEKYINEYKSGNTKKQVFGPMDSIRDYIEESQVKNQILAIINNGIPGETYNVGSGKPIIIRDLMLDALRKNNIPEYSVEEKIDLSKNEVSVIYANIDKVNKLVQKGIF